MSDEILEEPGSQLPALPGDRSMSLAEIAQARPQAIELFVEAMKSAAKTLHRAAYALCNAEDFVLNRDKAGNEVAMLAGPGAQKIAPLLGLSIENLRGPDGQPRSEPLIELVDGKKHAVIIGDIYSRTLGTGFEAVRAERGEDEDFTGRSGRQGDLKASAYTLLISKAVRDLLGMSRIPVSVLAENGIDVSRCRKGHGYGSAASREKTQESGVDAGNLEARAKALWKRMVEVGGDENGAKTILQVCSRFEVEGKSFQARDWKHLIAKGSDKWLEATRRKFEAEHEPPEPA